jgi:hypothetical protein
MMDIKKVSVNTALPGKARAAFRGALTLVALNSHFTIAGANELAVSGHYLGTV